MDLEENKAFLINKFVKGKSLDIGSAEGLTHKFLESFSKKRIDSLDVEGSPTIKCDLNNPPYKIKSRQYDSIIAADVIEHLEQPFQFIRECKRILTKNGRLIITTPNMTGLQNILADNKGIFRKESLDKKRKYLPHIVHWQPYQFAYILKREGFKIVKIKTFNHHWKRNILARTIAYIFPKLRTHFLVVTEKP